MSCPHCREPLQIGLTGLRRCEHCGCEFRYDGSLLFQAVRCACPETDADVDNAIDLLLSGASNALTSEERTKRWADAIGRVVGR